MKSTARQSVAKNKIIDEQEHISQLEQALQKSEALNQFYAMWVHELRSPVLALKANLQAITPHEKDSQAWLNALQASDLIEHSVDDLLSLAQFEQERFVLQSQTVNLKQVCQSVAAMAEIWIGNKPIQWRMDLPQDEVILVTDPYRLKQILINLITNAIKFTQKGEVVLKVFHNSQAWCFQVSDTGEGIAKQKQKNLFKPFNQLTQQVSHMASGSGLGLSIVHYLVGAMGGQIRMKSTMKKGSMFEVCLPLQSQIESSAKPSVPQLDLKGKKILIADDSALSREVLAQSLKDFNPQLFLVGDGKSALEVINQQPIDYVFVDQFMPNMTGVALCHQIRKRQKQGALVCLKGVFLLSAEPLEQSKNLCCFDAVRLKPLVKEGLVELLTSKYKNVYKKFKKTNCKKFIHGKIPNELTHLVPNFIREIRQNLRDIDGGLQNKDQQTVLALAHKMKGSMMLFNQQAWVKCTQEMADNIKSGDFAAAKSIWQALDGELNAMQ